MTQTGGGAVNITATAGTIKLTNTANNVSGSVNLSAAPGGLAFANNNAAGIFEGNITAATSMNTTNAASIANFTASDAALTVVVLLQALQGNIERSGTSKIVADRAVLVAANRIGGATATDATLGVRVEGAAGASAREVYVSAGTWQRVGGRNSATTAPGRRGRLLRCTHPRPLRSRCAGRPASLWRYNSPATPAHEGALIDCRAALAMPKNNASP